MNKKHALWPPVIALASMTTFAAAGSGKDVALSPPPPPSCAWTLGASALYLEADGQNYGAQDYEFSYRLDLMYDNGGTFGYRLSYFNFEGTDNYGKQKNDTNPEISSFDLELVRDLSLGSWQGSYSFGLRYLEYDDLHGDHSDIDFDGWGPTAGIDLVTPLGGSSWGVYCNVRGSWVFGEDDHIHDGGTDDLLILEAGLGIQYTWGDCNSFLRLGVEGQRYFDVEQHGNSDDTDLLGAALKVGFRF